MKMLQFDQAYQVPEYVKKSAQQQLNELLQTVTGVHFVMLCTTDGFEVALSTKRNMDNASKVAAVSSSILAMVSAFISEISLIGCKSITLDADNGKVMLAAVDHPSHPMVLVASTTSDVLLGQMNFYMKKAVEALVQIPR
jgi:predicted regulator of Ras-like GTPase activity (Roadblock/LC7/MglB family)